MVLLTLNPSPPMVRPPIPGLGARSSVVEHLTFNQEVVRSIRTGLTKENKGLARKHHQKFEALLVRGVLGASFW